MQTIPLSGGVVQYNTLWGKGGGIILFADASTAPGAVVGFHPTGRSIMKISIVRIFAILLSAATVQLAALVATLLIPSHASKISAHAHSGGLNSEGCHAGSRPYHCHRGSPAPKAGKKRRKAEQGSRSKGSERAINSIFCASIGGREEVRHNYNYPGGSGYIIVDCETNSHVWEAGLDKRSSLDSLQQAIFASSLTGKRPAIVIFDRDGQIGKYEYRISTAAKAAGVRYESR